MAQRFTDSTGNTWIVDCTVYSIGQVRKALEINLIEAIGTNLLQRLANDPESLVNVLWVLCREQAEAAGVSDVDFGRGMAGDAIMDATRALVEALIDFFPSARREPLRAIWKKVQEVDQQTLEMATKKVNDPRINQAITRTMAKQEQMIDERLNRLIYGDESTN